MYDKLTTLKSSHMYSIFKYKYLIIIFILSFISINVYSQHPTFQMEERGLESYDSYATFIQIKEKYAEPKDSESLMLSLDSLSKTINKRKHATEYLFLRNELGNTYTNVNKRKKAVAILKEAMTTFAKRNDTICFEYTVTLQYLSDVDEYIDDSYTEIRYYQAQIDIFNKLGITGKILNAVMLNKAVSYIHSDKAKAIGILYEVRNNALDINDVASITRADYTIINAIKNIDLQRSKINALKSDLLLLKSAEQTSLIKITTYYFYHIIANTYSLIEEYDNAIVYYKLSNAMLGGSPKESAVKSNNYAGLAICYAQINIQDSVLSYYRKSFELIENSNISSYNKSLTYTNLAYALEDSIFVLADLVKKEKTGIYFEDNIIEIKATVYSNKGENEKAVELLSSFFTKSELIDGYNVPVIDDSTNYLDQFHLISTLIYPYKQICKDNPKPILSLINKQIELYRKISTDDVYSTEISYFSDEYNAYSVSALKYVLSLDDKDNYKKQLANIFFASKAIQMQAFTNKTNALAEEISDTNSLKLLRQNAKLQNLNTQLSQTNISEQTRDSLGIIMNRLYVDNLFIRYNIQNNMKPINNIITIPSIANIQSKLKEKEGIIEYVVSDSSVMYSLITQDTAIFNIKNDLNLNQYISKQIYSIKTGRKSTGELSKLLFLDIEDILVGLNNLIIIPDNRLAKIPFETFHFPTTGNLFVSTINISYSFGTAFWYSQERKEIYANNNIISIAPFAYSTKEVTDYYLSDISRETSTLRTLYYSEDEVNSINSTFNKNSKECKILIDKEATEENVKEEISKYDIIHIASHSMVNNEDLEKSSIFLYQDNDENIDELVNDNILSLGEVYNMNLKSNLVFLSSCSSASGQYSLGEGIVAFPRAFIIAGSKSVIASLWPVNDLKTKEFISSFYSILLNKNVSYSEALRLAKAESIKKGFLTLDWAGFVLIH